MSTTKIYSDLFQNDGSGVYLRNDIIPVLPLNLYVDIDNGDDGNDGTEQHPLKTITGAKAFCDGKIMIHDEILVHLAGSSNSYEDLSYMRFGIITSYISVGNITTVGVTANGLGRIGLIAGEGTYTIKNGSIAAVRGGILAIANGVTVNFTGSRGSYCIGCWSGGTIYTTATASVTFNFNNAAITGTNPATVSVYAGGAIQFPGTDTWSGTVSGSTVKKYWVRESSSLSGIGSTSVIPGAVAGTVSSDSSFS